MHFDLLASKFPRLSFAYYADKWLECVNSKSILEQVLDRRILAIEIAPSMAKGLLLPQESGGFWVRLDSSPHEYAFTLGHEIAHTFHFDLLHKPPQSFFPIDRSQTFWTEQIEPFCDLFAHYWLKLNGESEVRKFFKDGFGQRLDGLSVRFFEYYRESIKREIANFFE